MAPETDAYLVIDDPSGQLPLQGLVLLPWGAQIAFARHRCDGRRRVEPFDLLQTKK